jgi:hypothetical protein
MLSSAIELEKDVQGLGCPSEGISMGIPDHVSHESLTVHEMTFDASPSAFEDDGSKSRYYSKAKIETVDDYQPDSRCQIGKSSTDENKIRSNPLESPGVSPEESFVKATNFQSRLSILGVNPDKPSQSMSPFDLQRESDSISIETTPAHT